MPPQIPLHAQLPDGTLIDGYRDRRPTDPPDPPTTAELAIEAMRRDNERDEAEGRTVAPEPTMRERLDALRELAKGRIPAPVRHRLLSSGYTPETVDSLPAHAARAHVASHATLPVHVAPFPGFNRSEHPFTGRIVWHGIPIGVENVAGSMRSGVSPDGTPWSVRMLAHYGEVQGKPGITDPGLTGAYSSDGDKWDVYVNPHGMEGAPGQQAYTVCQCDLEGKFDEPKTFLGWTEGSDEAVRKMYVAHFDDGRGMKRFGGMVVQPVEEFKEMVGNKEAREAMLGRLRGMAEEREMRKGFNPSEPRDANGKWLGSAKDEKTLGQLLDLHHSLTSDAHLNEKMVTPSTLAYAVHVGLVKKTDAGHSVAAHKQLLHPQLKRDLPALYATHVKKAAAHAKATKELAEMDKHEAELAKKEAAQKAKDAPKQAAFLKEKRTRLATLFAKIQEGLRAGEDIISSTHTKHTRLADHNVRVSPDGSAIQIREGKYWGAVDGRQLDEWAHRFGVKSPGNALVRDMSKGTSPEWSTLSQDNLDHLQSLTDIRAEHVPGSAQPHLNALGDTLGSLKEVERLASEYKDFLESSADKLAATPEAQRIKMMRRIGATLPSLGSDQLRVAAYHIVRDANERLRKEGEGLIESEERSSLAEALQGAVADKGIAAVGLAAIAPAIPQDLDGAVRSYDGAGHSDGAWSRYGNEPGDEEERERLRELVKPWNGADKMDPFKRMRMALKGSVDRGEAPEPVQSREAYFASLPLESLE